MLEKTLGMIADVGESDADSLGPDTELFDSGVLDSFAVVELLVAIESELGIKIALTEFDRNAWSTPAKIAAFLEARAG